MSARNINVTYNKLILIIIMQSWNQAYNKLHTLSSFHYSHSTKVVKKIIIYFLS